MPGTAYFSFFLSFFSGAADSCGVLFAWMAQRAMRILLRSEPVSIRR